GGVQVVADRDVVVGADRVEDREHVVLLDQLPGQHHRLRRVVRVVEVDVLDLPAVHAAVSVDVLEVRVSTAPDGAEERGRAGDRHRAADRDRGGRDAGTAAGEHQCGEPGERGPHRLTGFVSVCSAITAVPRLI